MSPLLGRDLAPLVLGRGVHLGALTAVLARHYGDRPAFEHDAPTPGLHDGGVRTTADLEVGVARLAAAHRAGGIAAGDHVLVVLPNRVDILLHVLALARIGAVAVPVNDRLKAGEIASIADSSDAVAAVADGEQVARLADEESLGSLVWRPTDTGEQNIADWLATHQDASVAPVARDPDATALLLTTSGTTGTPKAAALTSHGLLSALGRLAAAPVGYQHGPRGERDLLLAALPLTHVMGFAVTLGALCAGVPLLFRDRFHAEEVLDLVEQRRPNVFVGVPTMYADLDSAGAGSRDLSSIQLWVSAADKMPPERARRFQDHGAAFRVAGRPVGRAAFVDVYGMVELSGAAAVRVYPPSVGPRIGLPAVAVVLPGIEVRAVDPEGNPVGWGTEGELQFRGGGVLERYEGVEGTGPDAAGWFATGDHGRLWPGGIFAFAGRSRDRIKVGGFSVFPAEVEEELHDAPGVGEVALVGVADDRLGERPVALVVPNGAGFDEERFLAWAHEHVAGYRRPQQVLVVDGLPHGPNRKIDRQAATQLAEERLAKEPS